MTHSQRFSRSIRRALARSIQNLENWLLAHESRQADPLVAKRLVRSAADRALEYDVYMRSNRTAKNSPLECTVEFESRRNVTVR